MRLDELKLETPLQIHINRGGYHFEVTSKIRQAGPGYVSVTRLGSRTQVFEFRKTDVVEIIYREEDKDRLWKWKNVEAILISEEEGQFHRFISFKEGESFNRRDNYRVFIGEKVILHYLVNNTKNLEKMQDLEELSSHMAFDYDVDAEELKRDWYRYLSCDALLHNISESGIGFYTNQLLEKGDQFAFEVETDAGKIDCKGIIVRKSEKGLDSFSYYYGGKVVESSGNMAKYIYDLQREQLKKVRHRV